MARIDDVDMSNAPDLTEGFKAIPPGDYQLYMESSERKPTKSGTGEYLECVLVVCAGPYTDSKIFCRFNLWNQNQQAVDIAKGQWRALCEATLGQPFAISGESSSLHNKLFIAEVDNVPMNKDDPNSKRTNEIIFRKGKIRNAQGVSSQPAAAQQAPAPVAQAPQPTQVPQAAAPAPMPTYAPPPAAVPTGAPPQATPYQAPIIPGKGKQPWNNK